MPLVPAPESPPSPWSGGFLLFNVTVTDRGLFDAYAGEARAILAEHGGVIVLATEKAELLEGSWRPGTIFLVRFETEAAARAFYFSDRYQALCRVREQASQSDGVLFAVEG